MPEGRTSLICVCMYSSYISSYVDRFTRRGRKRKKEQGKSDFDDKCHFELTLVGQLLTLFSCWLLTFMYSKFTKSKKTYGKQKFKRKSCFKVLKSGGHLTFGKGL